MADKLIHIIAKNKQLGDTVRCYFQEQNILICTYETMEEFLECDLNTNESCVILNTDKDEHQMTLFYPLLCAVSKRCPTILLTNDGNILSSVQCMKAGAVDYLLQSYNRQQVATAVYRALRIGLNRKEKEIATVHALICFGLLTERERVVMALVTSGLLNKQVAWAMGVSEATIKVHRSHVMIKMKVKTLPALVRLADLINLKSDGCAAFDNEVIASI